MKVKKIPLRTCVDETGKMNGRGAYIKKDIQVLEQARKKKTLERHLECSIEESVYDDIRKNIEK